MPVFKNLMDANFKGNNKGLRGASHRSRLSLDARHRHYLHPPRRRVGQLQIGTQPSLAKCGECTEGRMDDRGNLAHLQ
jgi:hypothetical protein